MTARPHKAISGKNKKLELDRSGQINIFDNLPAPEKTPLKESGARTFVSPTPDALSYGGLKLEKFLIQADVRAPLVIRDLLEQQDWGAFENKYASTGRAPYAPMNMLGLILYGFMQGVSSLRGLEEMARTNLGCHWISGAIFPDHASIGRFIVLHDEAMAGSFFESLTRSILNKTNANNHCIAGDGTIIEAACSYYHLLKEEAVKQTLADAKKAATPKDIVDIYVSKPIRIRVNPAESK